MGCPGPRARLCEAPPRRAPCGGELRLAVQGGWAGWAGLGRAPGCFGGWAAQGCLGLLLFLLLFRPGRGRRGRDGVSARIRCAGGAEKPAPVQRNFAPKDLDVFTHRTLRDTFNDLTPRSWTGSGARLAAAAATAADDGARYAGTRSARSEERNATRRPLVVIVIHSPLLSRERYCYSYMLLAPT